MHRPFRLRVLDFRADQQFVGELPNRGLADQPGTTKSNAGDARICLDTNDTRLE